MNTAIIVAAGSGKRFESSTPKQFLELLGRPVIFHTLERFDRCGAIDEVVVVLSNRWLDHIQEDSKQYSLTKPLKFVVGGETRSQSVQNGFRATSQGTEFVAVHDAARPLVTEAEILRTIEGAKETGAACLTSPVTDTIKEIKGKRINRTIDRLSLRRAVTPQVFRYDILRDALLSSDLGEAVTDECFLVEKIGGEIAYIEGSSRNIKITVPDDLIIAEALLKAEKKNAHA